MGAGLSRPYPVERGASPAMTAVSPSVCSHGASGGAPGLGALGPAAGTSRLVPLADRAA